MKRKILILIAVYIIGGILSRTILHLGPNVEFITAISISSAICLNNKKLALIVPISIMFLSDLIIGNSNIFIFTWSGFLFPVILGFVLSKLIKKQTDNKILILALFSELAGVTSSMFFFVWTNFGHWLTTNMYTKDIGGLISCYINAIPFLKPQLAGNLIIVPILVVTSYYIVSLTLHRKEKLAQA